MVGAPKSFGVLIDNAHSEAGRHKPSPLTRAVRRDIHAAFEATGGLCGDPKQSHTYLRMSDMAALTTVPPHSPQFERIAHESGISLLPDPLPLSRVTSIAAPSTHI